jgi:TPR repeat protein
MENLNKLAFKLYDSKQYEELGKLLFNQEDSADAEIQFLLGSLFDLGIDRKKDPVKAFSYFYKSAQNGNPFGERALGIYYFLGNGTEINEEKGLYWVNKSIDDGFVRAICTLAHIYMNGLGVLKDEKHAFELYLKAASLGDTHAMEHVSECCEKGIGTEIDLIKAKEYLNLSKAK